MDVSERFEQLIAFVSSQLPKPVEEQQSGDRNCRDSGVSFPTHNRKHKRCQHHQQDRQASRE